MAIPLSVTVNYPECDLPHHRRCMTDFFTALKTLWEKLDNSQPLPICHCPARTHRSQDFIISTNDSSRLPTHLMSRKSSPLPLILTDSPQAEVVACLLQAQGAAVAVPPNSAPTVGGPDTPSTCVMVSTASPQDTHGIPAGPATTIVPARQNEVLLRLLRSPHLRHET
ncbi:hypothetical protein PIB30_058900 [Stylosanthes scabra]|uniref:Uncharacterized protein n=1 Tax=Stylosanthes scabra TaxID=79078 RepID=A0ABU6QL18_9FABA|nr:hypothetical protein [Stylosanthes scabra]